MFRGSILRVLEIFLQEVVAVVLVMGVALVVVAATVVAAAELPGVVLRLI